MVYYRKYRPQTFSEIVGQEHVTTTLQNALQGDLAGHAYLFAGPRGTGKTSVARLFAKAINCKKAKKGEPCGTCDVCKAVQNGTFLDLIEIDAASNRGIDDIRSLREKVHFQPVQGKQKVYVLDEVHMLTKEAFNALLKTLEEPPKHVTFILCTTEQHKLPITVISRCQRFSFNLADKDVLISYIQDISKKESIQIEASGLELIAQLARGSYRDAITLLEQVRTMTKDTITKDTGIRLLGLTEEQDAEDVLHMVMQGQIDQAVARIDVLAQDGKNMSYLTDAMLEQIKNKLPAIAKDDSAVMYTWLYLAHVLYDAREKMRYASIAQLPLQMACITFALQKAGKVSNKSVQRTHEKPDENPSVKEQKEDETSSSKIPKHTVASHAEMWNAIMEKLKPYNHSVHALLKGCEVEKIEDGIVHLGFFYKFHKERIEESKNRLMVEEVCSGIIGDAVRIKCYLRAKNEDASQESKKTIHAHGTDEELSEDDLIKITKEILGGEVEDV